MNKSIQITETQLYIFLEYMKTKNYLSVQLYEILQNILKE